MKRIVTLAFAVLLFGAFQSKAQPTWSMSYFRPVFGTPVSFSGTTYYGYQDEGSCRRWNLRWSPSQGYWVSAGAYIWENEWMAAGVDDVTHLQFLYFRFKNDWPLPTNPDKMIITFLLYDWQWGYSFLAYPTPAQGTSWMLLCVNYDPVSSVFGVFEYASGTGAEPLGFNCNSASGALTPYYY